MDDELKITIRAETDAFVKSVNDIKTRCGQVAAQIKEIDKQLKSENVDRVAKLAEKMELVQRQANLAAKEGKAYQEQIDKLNEVSQKNSGLTEEQQRKLENLTEKMKLAEQKAQTYATEVEDLGKELEAEKEAAEKAKEETESLSDEMAEAENSVSGLADEMKDAGEEAKKAGDKTKDFKNGIEDGGEEAEKAEKKVSSFFKSVLTSVTGNRITKGLDAIGNMFQEIGEKALEAAKDIAEYFNESVELAAGYADALGYSEQVFTSESEAVKKWVEDNSVALRIGQADLLDYVNKTGALFTTFGFSAKDSAKNAEALVQLAVDLQAATGDELPQIFQSLTGAMTGSYETMKRYGVVVSSARVEAKAYAMGLVDVEADELAVKEAALKLTEATQKSAEALSKYGENSVEYEKSLINVEKAEKAYAEATEGKASEISEVAKQTALLALEQEDLAFMEGQAAKEADSYSAQLSTWDTLLQNLKLTIGEKLLPVYTEFQKKVNEFLQSDAWKGVIDAVTEAIGDMAEKVLDFIQSEEFTSWVESLEEEIPKLTEKIEDWAEKFGELFDKAVEWVESGGLEELIEDIKGMAEAIEKVLDPIVKLIDAFDTLSDMDELDEAVKKSKEEVHRFADSLGIDYESMIGHITKFAEENHLKTADVLNDWQTYEPQVETYIQSLSNETSEMKDTVSGDMDAAAGAFKDAVNDMANANTGGVAAVASEVESSASRIQTACRSIGDWLSGIDWLNAPGSGTEARASGGSVSAGQAYLVGEQGREIFVPQTNGYILNSGQTERVLNQSTDNSRSIGALNVYLTSYGASAEEISDEIGAAISQKLRLSGAW